MFPPLAPVRSVTVAPFTGAWIEMLIYKTDKTTRHVAPFTGAWIEITMNM